MTATGLLLLLVRVGGIVTTLVAYHHATRTPPGTNGFAIFLALTIGAAVLSVVDPRKD